MNDDRTMDMLTDLEELIVLHPEDFENYPQLTDNLVSWAVRFPENRLQEAGWNSDAYVIWLHAEDTTFYPQLHQTLTRLSHELESQRRRNEFYKDYEARFGDSNSGSEKTAGQRAVEEMERNETTLDDIIPRISEYPGYADAMRRQREYDDDGGDAE